MTEINEVRGGDRVSVETTMRRLFKDLSDRSSEHPETAPTLRTRDLFMWTIVLGARKGKRLPLEGGKQRIFEWDQLSQDLDFSALKALAVADTEEVEVLLHENQVPRVAEEYANVGIREAKGKLIDQSGQPLWNLVGLSRQPSGQGNE